MHCLGFPFRGVSRRLLESFSAEISATTSPRALADLTAETIRCAAAYYYRSLVIICVCAVHQFAYACTAHHAFDPAWYIALHTQGCIIQNGHIHAPLMGIICCSWRQLIAQLGWDWDQQRNLNKQRRRATWKSKQTEPRAKMPQAVAMQWRQPHTGFQKLGDLASSS